MTYLGSFGSFPALVQVFLGSSGGCQQVSLILDLLRITSLSFGWTSPKVDLRCLILLTKQRKWGIVIGLPRRKGLKLCAG